MVKFSHGMWWNADGVLIDWAVEAAKSEALEGSIRCVATSKHINHRGDILNTPTLTVESSSPAPDILLLTGYHWKGQKHATLEPNYELFPDVQTHSTNPTIVAPGPNHLLTRLGWRSVGYIKKGTNAINPKFTLTDPDKGERWFTMQFQISVGEKIYGLGERFGPFTKNGQVNKLLAGTPGTDVSSRVWRCGTRTEAHHPNRPTKMFPSFSAPAGMESSSRILVLPALPPAWSFGLWLSTSFTTQYDETTVTKFLEGMDKRDIPVGVFHYDCFWQKGFHWCDYEFDKEYFPDAGEQLARLKENGYNVKSTDFGERIPTGNTVTFEVLERRLGKNESIVFARSATAGGQRFPVHWGGDPMSTFEAMAETLRGGLSLGLCGHGYWAHDIGGFEGTPDPALYKRWFAFGCLSSHSRLHGSGSYRVPWLIDESGEADVVLKRFIGLKLSLMPYIYSTAIKTHETGVAMMRPLFVEFPEDPFSWNVDTQYMFGASLMVVPIFSAEGTVQYYVPNGRWFGILDGKLRTGPAFVTELHDFLSLPLLLRPGAAIVLCDNVPRGAHGRKHAVYDYSEGITVVVNLAGGSPIDVFVEVPDSNNLGAFVASLAIQGNEESGTVNVVRGTLKGEWKVKKVKSDGTFELLVAMDGQKYLSWA
ncbi:hypothetical protein C0993_007361 [Termitomyces sp. T159_Od127]|nr:hypothetical protein C0993_007361 [Termitomyces sp. T159_Od127]